MDKKLKKIKPGMAAGFDYSTGIIYIRKDASVLDLYHEGYHAEMFASVGKENYVAYGKLVREEYVYEQVMKNSHLFNDKEIKLSKDYIEDLRRKLK